MDQMAHRVSTAWKEREYCAAAGIAARIPGAVSPVQLANTMMKLISVYI
jgi:hypothetical protein